MRKISEQLLGKIEEAIEYFGGVSEEERECLEAAIELHHMFDDKEISKTVLNSLIYTSKEIISKIIDNYDFWNPEDEKNGLSRKEKNLLRIKMSESNDVWFFSDATYRYRLSKNNELNANDLKLLAIIYVSKLKTQYPNGNEKIGNNGIETIENRINIIKRIIEEKENAEETKKNLSETAGLFGSEGRKQQPGNVENDYN